MDGRSRIRGADGLTYDSLAPVMKRFCSTCYTPFDDGGQVTCPECGTTRPDSEWPADRRLGETVVGGQYRVLRRLGAGGFGVVYLVETVVGGLRRALKVLHTEWLASPEMRDRFINEAVVLEQVNHPNVARCYAVGTLEDDEALYILLELVDGVPLSALLKGDGGAARTLTPARAVRIAKQVASGLVVAHANDVLHRDLKPDNILIRDPGTAEELAKLIDFGIAKTMAERTAPHTGDLLGTPLHMAPEQIAPGTPLDARVDLWQLGAVLFQMLTGQVPYADDGEGMAGLKRRHAARQEEGPRPSEINPALASHPPLDTLVSRLLSTSPPRRPRGATQVCEELARVEHTLLPKAAVTGSMGLLEALCATPGEGAWWALTRYLSEQGERQEQLVARAETLMEEWPEVLRRAPVSWWETVRRGEPHPLWSLARALDLSGRCLGDDDVEALVAQPSLVSLTHLTLADNEIGNTGVLALASSPRLQGLKALDLSRNRITAAGAQHLVASQQLTQLRHLSLAGNGLGIGGAEALARAPFPLRTLDLTDNDLQAAGATALAGSAALADLETLSLAGNQIGSDGAGAVAVSHTLTQLRSLDLSHNGIGASGMAALALSNNVGRLRALRLAQNNLGLQGIELLLQSNRLAALEELDLASNEFGAQGAMALSSSPFTRRLKALQVADNALGDAGLAALLGASHLTGLRSLGVSQNGVTAAGATLLGGASGELEDLDLSTNELGPAGAAALGAVLPRTHLSRLNVSACGLTGEAIATLIQGGRGVITSLAVAGNGLEAEGVRRLAAVAEAGTLVELDVSSNGLGATGVEALALSPYLKNLRRLAGSSNGLRDEDGATLARAFDMLPNLEDLEVSDNGLGAVSAVALSTAAVASRLVRLGLAHNQLGDGGAGALAQGRWHALQELDIERNGVSLAAAASLLSAPGVTVLSRVRFSHNALAGEIDMNSLAQQKVEVLEASFAAVAAQPADVAELFYGRLFARYPAVKPLFAHISMRKQQQHLMDALVTVIDNLRQPDAVEAVLKELGERHIDYGALPSHYHAVTSTLLATLRDVAGDAWTDEVDDAWHDGLEAVVSVMLRAHRART